MRVFRLLAFLFLIFSFTASAELEIKAIVLNDDSIIMPEEISGILIDETSSSINSVELYNHMQIDSSYIKSIILKNTQDPKPFQRRLESSSRVVVGNGNGSGG